jgi:hypothetical protein
MKPWRRAAAFIYKREKFVFGAGKGANPHGVAPRQILSPYPRNFNEPIFFYLQQVRCLDGEVLRGPVRCIFERLGIALPPFGVTWKLALVRARGQSATGTI